MLQKIVDALEEIRAEEFDYEILQAAAEVMGQDTVSNWRPSLSYLPPEQRDALLLVGSDGLSPSEAAEVLGISSAAFRVRLFRARRLMRSLLPPPASNQPRYAVPTEVEK